MYSPISRLPVSPAFMSRRYRQYSGARRGGSPAARFSRVAVGGVGRQEHHRRHRRRARLPFDYLDKGIMAMINRNAAIAEIGTKRHELHGQLAVAAWIGVHTYLLTGIRNRLDAFVSWMWNHFSTTPQARKSSTAATPPASIGTTTPSKLYSASTYFFALATASAIN